MNPSLIPVLSAMAAAVWSVWTWQSEQQKGREIKRNEMSAQYVNNFIVATQELQRELYKILEEGELEHYKSSLAQSTGHASPIAIDLLFALSTFFGWELMTFRFGPYTRDPRMIAILAEIAEMINSRSRFPGAAFRFNLGDRHALGQSVVRRVGETSSGPAFVNISRFKFEEEIEDERGEWSRLFASEQVRCSLAAVDRAIAGEALEGRERLAVLQNLLVDLISYLEQQEGFRTSFGERKRAIMPIGHIDVTFQPGTGSRILHQMPGRIRLGVSRLHSDKACAGRLQSILEKLEHVEAVRVNAGAACVVVEFSADAEETAFARAALAIIENELGGFPEIENVVSARQVPASKPSIQNGTSLPI